MLLFYVFLLTGACIGFVLGVRIDRIFRNGSAGGDASGWRRVLMGERTDSAWADTGHVTTAREILN